MGRCGTKNARRNSITKRPLQFLGRSTGRDPRRKESRKENINTSLQKIKHSVTLWNSMNKTISSASYSRLLDFESCRYKAFLKHVERIPDPSPHVAADRGTDIHNRLELFVRGKGDAPTEALKHFSDEVSSLKNHFDNGNASLEGEWAFDNNWVPTAWKGGWFRLKADAVVYLSKHHAAVVDYKTGKRFGNELKHAEQLQLYALAVLLREPDVEHVTAELWYLDQNEIATCETSRQHGMRALKGFDNRARKMTTATTFHPNPNAYSCKWCPYKPEHLGGTGHCPVGV